MYITSVARVPNTGGRESLVKEGGKRNPMFCDVTYPLLIFYVYSVTSPIHGTLCFVTSPIHYLFSVFVL